jgi:DNA-binding NarL/FixJ family response regulator
MPFRAKAVLWVDDEAELLEPHRILLRDKGFDVEAVSNADDAVHVARRRPFDLVLLDEQMPGKRGLEAYRELRGVAPNTPVVMVTKSEEDETLTEALRAGLGGYLVKPITPRQVYALVARLLEGPRIRSQAVARSFVDRFRQLQTESMRDLDWRGWIARYDELTRWDLDLADAGESGLYETLQGLYPDARRAFATYMREAYPAWLANLEGDRPPLSVDVVRQFVVPAAEQHGAALFVVIDAMRLDQWRVLEGLIAPLFEVETANYFAILPTATPYARNALFSGLFPAEIAARHPDWWADDRGSGDESLNQHERELLEAHVVDLGRPMPVRYEKICTAAEATDLERRVGAAIPRSGIGAFVFNFVDLLTHGRTESTVLYEVARDEAALRQLTQQWFRRSAAFALLEEAARRRIPVVLTSDHGSIHCRTPATVYAKRDASPNLRFKFGEDLRAENPDQALLFRRESDLRLPRRGLGANTLLATGDSFFVYPTKLREYQGRYRGSFLHGGVTPEECILSASLLTPRS